MNNKYIIFTAMYRYGLLFMEDSPSIEAIRNTLTTTNPHTIIPGSKMIVKKALKDNFGVHDKESMEQAISELNQSAWEGGIIYAALIDIFLKHSEFFTELAEEQVRAFLEEGDRVPDYIQAFSPLWKNFELVDCLTPHTNKFKDAVAGCFSSENENKGMLDACAAIFSESKAWLGYTGGFSAAGFDFSRIISIVCDSHVSDYITDEEAEALLNLYGGATQALFKNWETFLFSAVLGKQLMSFASGRFIIDSKEYVSHCYRLAAHPEKLLAVSGIWPGSNPELFCTHISKQYELSFDANQAKVGESDPRLAFSQSVVLPVLEKFDMGYLLDFDMAEPEYVVPFADQSLEKFAELDYYINKLKFPLEADEIPFLANSKTLITNKYIRVTEKKLFSKKVHQFSWSESLDFSYSLTKLAYVAFKVNGLVMFNLPGNYKKANISKKDNMFLEKEDVLKYYSEDMRNAQLAFSELNKVLGGR